MTNVPDPPPAVPPAPPQSPVQAAPLSAPAASLFSSTIEALNVKQAQKKGEKAKQTNIDLRKVHWADVKDEDIWLLSNEHKRFGFAQVPRTLSLVINIINDIAKKKYGKAIPAGKTYFALWLHHYGEGLVRIASEAQIAYEAGYGGQRNVSTFRQHMEVLKEIGFIDFRKGVKGPMHYVLLLNPYNVMKRLRDQKDETGEKLVSDEQYAALVERVNDIGSRSELGE
nr:hypothetical protein [uncultured Caldimonas sp.]